MRGIDLRLRLVAGDLVVAIVQSDQRIARLDRLVGDHVDGRHIARQLR